MYTQIKRCRICGNSNLERVLDLGEQALTGVFPRTKEEEVGRGPLRLLKCVGEAEHACGLLQLEHSYALDEMYGENYGYRSGLNASMVAHLNRKVERISSQILLEPGDLVIDIGSNDATTLKAYVQPGLQLAGVDPTGSKFRDYYPPHIELIPDFFSAELVRSRFGDRKAKVVTSFSMFYDLEAPMAFMAEVRDILADDGIWVFEQSYMPSMLATNSFDTVCHEHLEFYALRQIQWMAVRTGLKIEDVEFNDVNGGSFSVTVRKALKYEQQNSLVAQILDDETKAGLDTLGPFQAFRNRVERARETVSAFVANARSEGRIIAGLGASTKGNVILQYCGLTADDIYAIGEVNSDKFGSFTPGSLIPIVSERSLLEQNPDYFLVLPWHFHAFFERSSSFVNRALVFPLPEFSISKR
ncbi:class I SAM-dependent methyltransferase [Sphingobium sp. 15-1]|uniref:class I SAM-dependent methyltransferase n=1 Tax=Sphingobium sp. 15-1 TaxID=2729616 RepID=UPI00159CAD56|nr:class I SAM-dependent methyltransferase [Sphingobium sp. 15-1]